MVKSRSDLNAPNLRMVFDKNRTFLRRTVKHFLPKHLQFCWRSLRMPKCMTASAVAARGRRANELETRRFNYTLKEYIEFKHSNIFQEYTDFYKALSGMHPTKKNLMKTKEFRDWKKQTIEQSFESDGIRAVVTDLMSEDSEPCVQEVSEGSTASETGREFSGEESTTGEVTDIEFSSEESTTGEVTDTEFSSGVSTTDEVTDMEVFSNPESLNDIIDGIVLDLERDAFFDQILGDNDEGIALDFQTELDSIIENFDYELEVDF